MDGRAKLRVGRTITVAAGEWREYVIATVARKSKLFS